MQTIKGLFALLLVAAGVFTTVMTINKATEPGSETVVGKPAVASSEMPVEPSTVGRTSDADPHNKGQANNL